MSGRITQDRVARLLLSCIFLVSAGAAPSLGQQEAPSTAAGADTPAASQETADPRDGIGNAPMQSEVFRGTGAVIGRPPRSRATGPQGRRDVKLNFVAVSIQEAAKAILGDLLGLNYAVDPAVQGTITVQTTGPVQHDQILPIFEASLEADKLVLVQKDNLYTIEPLAAGQRLGTMLNSANVGYGTEAVTLKYVNAAALKKVLDPLVPENGIAQSDTARNVLFITGSAGQRQAMREVIAQFDVNWLKGMSFAVFVPQWSNSQDLSTQLDKVLNADGAPTAGIIRIVPIDQMNAILAISPQPDYLDDVRKLVENLDRVGQSNQRRLFVYKVQNGRATDLASVLAASLGGSSAQNMGANGLPTGLGNAGANAAARPGTQTTQSGSTFGATSTGASAPGGSSFGTSAGSSSFGTAAGAASPQGQGVNAQTVNLGDGQQPMTITADDESNALVVYSTPQQYKIVEGALHKLDMLPLQVMIEATIGEVTLTDELQFGLQWFLRTGQHTFALSQGQTSTPTQTFPGFSYLLSDGNNIQVILNALKTVTTVNVLSSPELFVLNNHTASLQVGDEVPVTTASAVSVDTANAPLVNSVEYRDTGVILKVTPRVNDSGMVLLDIAQEVSDVSTTNTSNIDSPTIQERRIASSVAVRDGQTIVLGGLIKDTREHDKSGLPYLRDIPVVGQLFGSRMDSVNRTELVVLLTPRVVRNEPDAKALIEELKQKLPAAKDVAEKGFK